MYAQEANKQLEYKLVNKQQICHAESVYSCRIVSFFSVL